MAQAEFYRPANLDEACALLTQYGAKAKVIAGGTDLMVAVNRKRLSPEVLIYIGDCGLNYVKMVGDQLVIGAFTTHTELAKSSLVMEKAPLLAEAVGQIGSRAIRNMGTIGGNLVTASPAADGAAALMALDAELKLVSQNGERVFRVESFFTGPGETVRQAHELIKEIIIPPQAAGSKHGWYKLGQRKADVCGAVSAAIVVEMQNGTCRKARIVLGAVAPTPLLAQAAGSKLQGKALDHTVIAEAAQAAANATAPIDDWRATAWYRQRASGAIVKRLLEQISV
ncbi:MAG: FAD binding domain-containing protein [Desulfobacterales bacterium]|nr:MAG: FAD binding domain-containing protein [Desulfobacterales bacterium]